MTEATAAVPLPPRVPVSLTTVDNLFSITHQWIHQYRQEIYAFTGTSMFIFFNIQIRSLIFF